jgi:hypothetical protein
MVDEWAKLGKRLSRQGSGEPDLAGPLQEIWMTMASGAGDLANLSYKWVQSIDGLAGFSSARRPERAAARRAAKKTTAKKRAPRTAAKRTAAKRTAAKKTAAKKTPPKKTPPRR